MQAYQEMPYANFLKRNSAEYIISIQSHTGSYAAVLQICLKTLSELFMASVILMLLAFTNGPALGLLVILLSVMVFGYDRLFRIKVRNYGERSNKASVRMVQGIHEGIEGLKEIRILGKEHYFQEVVHKNALEVAENQVKTLVISSSPRYLLEFILITFFVSLVAGSILIGQDLKSLIPTLGIFGIAALRIMPSANQFSSSLTQLRSMSHTISILYDDMLTLKKQQLFNKTQLNPIKEEKEFYNLSINKISFVYPNTEFAALNDLSLKINKGESIGLIGPSGSGKTTLVDVLLGMLEPNEGSICYNGESLKESLAIWRSQVAYLPQDVFLIDNTLRRNVALGVIDKEIDDLRVDKALRKARLIELLEQLPIGVNTMLGERGIRLSGGQRQRVALARAFYHQREVLVMDEATSALDNETENEIVEEIKHLKKEKTLIVIAHRLSTVQHCDRIYKMDHGSIIDCGTAEKMLPIKKL